MTGEGDLHGTTLTDLFEHAPPRSQRLTRKLAIRWTLGSTLFLASFAAVMGPMAYVQHLLSGQRLPFTAAYFGSVALTLYFSMGVSHSRPCQPIARACRCRCREVADTSFLAASKAPQHNSHPVFRHHPARRLDMVPLQLLPNGNKHPAYGYIFRCPESHDVDVGLIWAHAVQFSGKLVASHRRQKMSVGMIVFWLASIVLPTMRLIHGPLNYEREAYWTCVFQEAGKPRLVDGSRNSKNGEQVYKGLPLWPRKCYKKGRRGRGRAKVSKCNISIRFCISERRMHDIVVARHGLADWK